MATYDSKTRRWTDNKGRDMRRWRVFGDGHRSPVYAMAATEAAAIRACHSAGISGMQRDAYAVPDDQQSLF